jgi:hypothetical protein
MWTGPCLPEIIKLLKDEYFIWLLSKFVVPFVLGAVDETHGLIYIFKNAVLAHDKVGVGDCGGIGYTERMLVDGLYRTPCLRIWVSGAVVEVDWGRYTFTIITRP